MTDINKISEAVRLILEKILTPIIYMYETESKIEFICFCSAAVSDDELYSVSEKLTEILSCTVELIDIYEYNENDRIDIISSAELVYSEHPIIEQMFELSMAEEYRRVQEKKQDMLKRKHESGAYYIQ